MVGHGYAPCVKQRVRDEIDVVLDDAEGALDTQTARLRRISDRLGEKKLSVPAGVADSVADEFEQLTDRLSDVDGERVIEEARAQAERRGPWLFMAGGAAMGLAIWLGLRRSVSDDPDASTETNADADDAAPALSS